MLHLRVRNIQLQESYAPMIERVYELNENINLLVKSSLYVTHENITLITKDNFKLTLPIELCKAINNDLSYPENLTGIWTSLNCYKYYISQRWVYLKPVLGKMILLQKSYLLELLPKIIRYWNSNKMTTQAECAFCWFWKSRNKILNMCTGEIIDISVFMVKMYATMVANVIINDKILGITNEVLHQLIQNISVQNIQNFFKYSIYDFDMIPSTIEILSVKNKNELIENIIKLIKKTTPSFSALYPNTTVDKFYMPEWKLGLEKNDSSNLNNWFYKVNEFKMRKKTSNLGYLICIGKVELVKKLYGIRLPYPTYQFSSNPKQKIIGERALMVKVVILHQNLCYVEIFYKKIIICRSCGINTFELLQNMPIRFGYSLLNLCVEKLKELLFDSPNFRKSNRRLFNVLVEDIKLPRTIVENYFDM